MSYIWGITANLGMLRRLLSTSHSLTALIEGFFHMTHDTVYRYVKGVTRSASLGNVLLVDFSPKKVCSFDCIYCAIGRTTEKIVNRRCFYPADEIADEVILWLEKGDAVDFAMLTGSGEPTLYIELGRLVSTLKERCPELKLAIYTNASLLIDSEVRSEIVPFDLISVNLNTDDENLFARICRPHEEVDLGELIAGIKLMRGDCRGMFWMDTVLVKGLNTEENVLVELARSVEAIGPDQWTIRPPLAPDGERRESKRIELPELFKERASELPFIVRFPEL